MTHIHKGHVDHKPTIATVQVRIMRTATAAGMTKEDWIIDQHIKAGQPPLVKPMTLSGLAGFQTPGRVSCSPAPEWLVEAIKKAEKRVGSTYKCAGLSCQNVVDASGARFVRQVRKAGAPAALLHFCSPKCMGVESPILFPTKGVSVMTTEAKIEERVKKELATAVATLRTEATSAVGQIEQAVQTAIRESVSVASIVPAAPSSALNSHGFATEIEALRKAIEAFGESNIDAGVNGIKYLGNVIRGLHTLSVARTQAVERAVAEQNVLLQTILEKLERR